jgi:hypothetical protein
LPRPQVTFDFDGFSQSSQSDSIVANASVIAEVLTEVQQLQHRAGHQSSNFETKAHLEKAGAVALL